MKFLCLHGAIGNPENFQVQLDPLLKELEKAGVGFQFAQGTVQVQPAAGFEEYFGPGPHYRFFDDSGLAEGAMMDKVRDFPELGTPEATLRNLLTKDLDMNSEKALALAKPPTDVLKPLYDMMDADEDIQGVIGYSEGAVVAGTLLLDDQHRAALEGRERRLKCGMFFAGWPPLSPLGLPVFSDTSDLMIEANTLHVIGAQDPYISGSMSLYNTCDENTAMIFDHGKGHTLPRDAKTLRELADNVKLMIDEAGCRDINSGNSSDFESVDYPSD